MMDCPECTRPMRRSDYTPINASGFTWERFRCDPCGLTAKVETTYEADEPEKLMTAPSIDGQRT